MSRVEASAIASSLTLSWPLAHGSHAPQTVDTDERPLYSYAANCKDYGGRAVVRVQGVSAQDEDPVSKMRKVPKSILLPLFPPCAERPYKGEKRNGKSLLELGRARQAQGTSG